MLKANRKISKWFHLPDKQLNSLIAIFVALTFAAVGTHFLINSRAASPYVSFEAAAGSLSDGASIVTNSGAADGTAVQFGSAITALPNLGTWSNVTSNLANMPSQCGNLTMLSAEPNSDRIIAGVAGDGLYATTNDGSSWSALGTGSGSDVITNRPSSISYDPTNSGTFWESGIYNSYGVYETTDNGVTFHHLGSTTHDDYVSVDFTDPSRQTILAGAHETSQRIDKSTDGGQTWTNIWPNLPSSIGGSFTQYPIIINAQTYLVDANDSWNGGNPGIYRSINGGSTWTQVSSVNPNTVPLITTSGTIYWSIGSGLVKSTNGGQTWTQVGSNLLNITPVVLPDGRLVSVNTSNNLVVSADGGSTWSSFGAALPFTPSQGGNVSLIYSPANKAFFISQWDCGNIVLPNAIARLQ